MFSTCKILLVMLIQRFLIQFMFRLSFWVEKFGVFGSKFFQKLRQIEMVGIVETASELSLNFFPFSQFLNSYLLDMKSCKNLVLCFNVSGRKGWKCFSSFEEFSYLICLWFICIYIFSWNIVWCSIPFVLSIFICSFR